jgi:translation initiation factor 1A
MPKNKGKGGKTRRRGKNEPAGYKRELIYKEEGQEYAQVLRMLGSGRLEAYCFDGEKRLAHIRGKMQKKVWIAVGDIILVGVRDFQPDKVDVIYKYNSDEIKALKMEGELPDHIKINETGEVNEERDNDGILFQDIDDGQDLPPQQQTTQDYPTSDSEDDDEDLNIDDI